MHSLKRKEENMQTNIISHIDHHAFHRFIQELSKTEVWDIRQHSTIILVVTVAT